MRSISDPLSKVNHKIHSIFDTAQFKRWIKKSKAVDRSGKPLLLYHRTNNTFSVFDTKMSGKNQGKTHGDGIYLSASKDLFDYAGDIVMELYASICQAVKWMKRQHLCTTCIALCL